MHTKIIIDASALRDMWHYGLLEGLERMGYDVFTTNRAFIASELQPDYTSDVAANFSFIFIEKSTEDEFYRIRALHKQYPATSFTDCSVLVKATDRGYSLLTSDLTIRKIALENGITIINYHTLLGNMVQAEVITILKATEAYLQLTYTTGTLTGYTQTVQHPAALFSLKTKSNIA